MIALCRSSFSIQKLLFTIGLPIENTFGTSLLSRTAFGCLGKSPVCPPELVVDARHGRALPGTKRGIELGQPYSGRASISRC
jgi:hypothetical protein